MVTRIGGINSNLDTEAIITAILDAEKTPITRLENKIEKDETKLTAYSELQSRVSLLQTTSYQLSLYSTWAQKTTSSLDSSIATASASLGAQTGDYNLTVTTLAKNHRIAAKAQTSITEPLGYTGKFSVQGESIEVADTDTITSIAEKINTAMLNVSADSRARAYIIDKTLVIEMEKTGASTLNITDDEGSILQSAKLGIFNVDSSFTNELQEASGFVGKINGVDVTSNTNLLENAVSGVKFTAKSTGSTTLSVTNDTDTVKQLISDFVTQYNDVAEYVRTQSQVVMSNSEELSAVGILQGDTFVSSFSNSFFSLMASSINNPSVVSSDFNSLQKIGIWVTSGTVTQFEINNKGTLDAALADHFDDVKNLFRANSGETMGIAKKMDTYLKGLIDPISGALALRVNTIETNISDSNKRITKLNEKIAAKEISLWEHFASMEEMVGEIKNQMNFMLSALGMSSSSS